MPRYSEWTDEIMAAMNEQADLELHRRKMRRIVKFGAATEKGAWHWWRLPRVFQNATGSYGKGHAARLKGRHADTTSRVPRYLVPA